MWHEPWRQGQRLYRGGWLDAAHEQFTIALDFVATDFVAEAQIMDAMGRIAMQRNRHQDGIHWFRQALSVLGDYPELQFVITLHLNMALSLGADEDRALRSLQRMEPQVSSQPRRQQAIYHLNHGVAYTNAQLYRQALERLRKAQTLLTAEDMPQMGYPLHTNLGVVLTALGDYAAARQELLDALEWSPDTGLHALNELTRLAILSNDENQAKVYGQQAIERMWSSLMTFEKRELANLSEILAQFAASAGDAALCRQLIDTAQTLYGQSGVWRHWRRLQDYSEASEGPHDNTAAPFLADIHRFLQMLQMMLAQDILHEKLPVVADVRTQVAEAMASAHGWDADLRRDLTLVSRLADLGLAAIDYDVVHDPHKSLATWNRYRAHPALSLQLLAPLDLPHSITEAIGDHHEQPDGGGFPVAKTASQISPLAQVFSVAHAYAWDVIYRGIPHSQTLSNLETKTPHELPEFWVHTLFSLFTSH